MEFICFLTSSKKNYVFLSVALSFCRVKDLEGIEDMSEVNVVATFSQFIMFSGNLDQKYVFMSIAMKITMGLIGHSVHISGMINLYFPEVFVIGEEQVTTQFLRRSLT